MSCLEFNDGAVKCLHCEDDEALCPTCAIRHTVDFQSWQVGARCLRLSIIREPAFISKTGWWETAKIHLEMHIDESCLGPPSTTTIGELVVLEMKMPSPTGSEVERQSGEGSLPSLVGSSISSTGDNQQTLYARQVANTKTAEDSSGEDTDEGEQV